MGTRRSKVMRLYRKKIRGSSALYKLKSNPSMMTAGVNLGNTLVNVSSSVLAADVAIKLLGDQGIGVVIGIMTFSILLFGEILPKTYANIHSEKTALRFSRILLAFTYVMYPFVLFLDYVTKKFLRSVGGHDYPKPITEEEIKEVIDLGLSDKALEYDEHMLVQNALEFDDMPILNVMTPKENVFSLDEKSRLSDVISEIKIKQISRIPIFSKSPENIVGILHIWDIAKLSEKDYETTLIGDIARKPLFVSSDKKISNLLFELRKNVSHMAIVLNQDKQLAGIITVEDLLEEIVGDIAGEM